jgi:hypothetical protein
VRANWNPLINDGDALKLAADLRRRTAVAVSLEDRKSLLGHKSGSVTSHNSGAEIGQMVEAANKVSATDSRGPVLTILKRRIG